MKSGKRSGWRDLNPRPLRPERSALAKLRYTPKKKPNATRDQLSDPGEWLAPLKNLRGCKEIKNEILVLNEESLFLFCQWADNFYIYDTLLRRWRAFNTIQEPDEMLLLFRIELTERFSLIGKLLKRWDTLAEQPFCRGNRRSPRHNPS